MCKENFKFSGPHTIIAELQNIYRSRAYVRARGVLFVSRGHREGTKCAAESVLRWRGTANQVSQLKARQRDRNRIK
jgi:ABC-type tungstate transport system permease subunit